MATKKNEVTQILHNIGTNNKAADLYPLVYDNLHEIAEKLYRRERPGHTLQPTILVNEATSYKSLFLTLTSPSYLCFPNDF